MWAYVYTDWDSSYRISLKIFVVVLIERVACIDKEVNLS